MQNSQLVSVLAISSLLLIVSGCDNTIRNNTVSTVTDMVTPSPQTLSNQVPLTEVKALISTPEGIAQVVTANNQFAIDMYQQINGQNKQADKNVFFSPYSLSTSMAMLYAAAEGETKAQIQRTFHYPSLNVLNPNSAALHEQFNKPNPNYQLATANDLWIQQGLRPNQNYLDTVQRYYSGKVTNLDFKNSPEPSRQTINKTIAKYTQQMIPEVLPASSIDADTVTVLTNAVYFKGDWKNTFAPSEKRPFNKFDGSIIDVDMMHEQAPYAYTEDAQVQVVQLPYKGDELSMLVVLPKAKDKIAMQRLVGTLSAKQISQWNSNLVNQEIILDLPKFKLEENYGMNSLLANMGMTKAFGSDADFGLFSQDLSLSVDAIAHKAVIEVDEKGTKAAASTSISIVPMSLGYSMNTIKFKVDHPFMFVIKDNKTNAILFLGQVNKP
ncbi:serpin family protein [Psychrobacter sp. ANT_H3]|uniref:serpin family protein n=1 Tax=Psychrobacter sp. ANT_H3 TaxID=3019444 RepID=UPI0022F19D86|nr:serpin family protein [Psychrobacter sp. ANT_H3]MDA5133393.1 serpin family protein [Psychrobacter sp. ANT_H3]|tara:strand:+ start:354 stop:1670 length:1317 start_codon:yes stop_codon:yes gene_type:complete